MHTTSCFWSKTVLAKSMDKSKQTNQNLFPFEQEYFIIWLPHWPVYSIFKGNVLLHWSVNVHEKIENGKKRFLKNLSLAMMSKEEQQATKTCFNKLHLGFNVNWQSNPKKIKSTMFFSHEYTNYDNYPTWWRTTINAPQKCYWKFFSSKVF